MLCSGWDVPQHSQNIVFPQPDEFSRHSSIRYFFNNDFKKNNKRHIRQNAVPHALKLQMVLKVLAQMFLKFRFSQQFIISQQNLS